MCAHAQPGHVTFDVHWDGSGHRSKVHEATFGFEGDFVDGNATISFSVTDDDSSVVYTSDAAGQSTVSAGVISALGRTMRAQRSRRRARSRRRPSR